MPNLPAISFFRNLDLRAVSQNVTNATASEAVRVICAWPVSAAYGPGVRWLYYLIIAACVFLRKVAWLRNFCLMSALLVPAVAALHAVVLASVHVNGTVDMDIYGAFQVCALGILITPLSVRLSRTYFNVQGRNVIFLWTCLNFAGLLCLIVEFYRSNAVPCPHGNNSNPISTSTGPLSYGLTSCDLKCNTSYAVSPLRKGAANNVYVVPAPTRLTFGTGTLLSGACCVLSALMLISQWKKILEINWIRGFGSDHSLDLPIEGTNGATLKHMKSINNIARLFISALEVPVWFAAALAILILGEINFFSAQVHFQTEPMATFGQWGPLVGAALAIWGSFYFLLSQDPESGDLDDPSIYLPLKEGQFRLFELNPGFDDSGPITGRVVEFDVKEAPTYIALSYVWGQEPDIHRIEINNKGTMIRPNLFQALQRLRARNRDQSRPFPRYLWIDSLCINQANLDEKNIQVGRMAEIYQKAESVFIWLGEEDFASNSAIAFVHRIVANKFTWISKWWEAYELTALDQLLERPLFRRRWVLQEAAFSACSIVICGGKEVPLDDLAGAVSLLRQRLSTAASTLDSSKNNHLINELYPAFYDSSATRVFALIRNVFQRSNAGDIVERRLQLENLVDLSTFCETSNQRDTIYALLSLAKEQDILSKSQPAYSLVLDYRMELLDVFAGFVLHCCYHSGSLDVICRPWAPGSASKINLTGQTTSTDRDFLLNPPSWIASKDQLPFGNPSLGLTQRLHGKRFVGRPPNPLEPTDISRSSNSAKQQRGPEMHAAVQNSFHHTTMSQPKATINHAEGCPPESGMELEQLSVASNRVYNAHCNTKPDVFLGRVSTTQTCTGSLFAKGIILGTITRRSVRMANAVIPRECFEVLSITKFPFGSHLPREIEDIWRILCADRNDGGKKAPSSFQSAYLEGVSRTYNADPAVPPGLRLPTPSIDVEELLQSDGLSEDAKRYFGVVREVVWNRRTFEAFNEFLGLIHGLAPPEARLDDCVCIVYGCSVPVILREHSGGNGTDSYWQLIGDAYVHNFMDGEGIRSLSSEVQDASKVMFEIR